MPNEEFLAKGQKRTLILCVDRDGDLAIKGGIKTPVVGRGQNLNAAVSLALHDPEEPDANAIFEAVRVYDRLLGEVKSEEVFEIATISGSDLGGVEADRKIVAELNELLGTFTASEVILVTDGYSDEAVLPLVQSRVPVSSVRRIVVKHSESIEETAAIFTRYLKMIVENPRYSRMALGLPGLLILILGILSIFNMLYYYWIAFVFVVSAFMLIKGFGVDRTAKNFIQWIREYSPPPLQVQISSYSAIAGVLCLGVSIYLGSANIPIYANIANWMGHLWENFGFFIQGSMDLMVIGVILILLGRAMRWYFEHDVKLLRNAVLIVTVGWFREILYTTSNILKNPSPAANANADLSGQLIFSIIIGILISVASILVALVIHRSAKGFFKKTSEHVEDFGEN